MEASIDTLNNFLSLVNTSFHIPIYQRNYSWEKDNCKKLLDDIVNIIKDKNKKHFIGTITYIKHVSSLHTAPQEYVIIDGQQRITTIMLLLKAIYNKTEDEKVKTDINSILGIGENNVNSNYKLRLKPIEDDLKAFKLVMEGVNLTEIDGSSKIKENYLYINEILDKYKKDNKEYKIEEIYNAFLRLTLVGIGLENGDDDPQVVFESINATGIHLKGVDLIRNFLMMDKNPNEQDRLFNEYWKPIENELYKDKEIEDFIQAYLRIHYGIDVKKDSYYDKFKKCFIEKFNSNAEELMEDLLKYSKIYKILIDKNEDIKYENLISKDKVTLRKHINIIIDIKFGVAYPFLMQILNDLKEGKLDFIDARGIIEVLISYHVRRQICGYNTAALNKITYTLYRDIKNKYGDKVNKESLQKLLGQKDGTETFPNDSHVLDDFIKRKAYGTTNVKLILLEIDKVTNKEPSEEDNLTVEHFYPQKPTSAWRELAKNYEDLEEEWIDTFGNLTLTGLNSKLGNKSFEEKLKIINEGSSLHLNKYFLDVDTWNIQEIKRRAERLAKIFINIPIFEDLPNSYRKKDFSYSLNEDITGLKIVSVSLPNGKLEYTSKLKDAAIHIIRYITENYSEQMEKYFNNQKPSFITKEDKKIDGYINIMINEEFNFLTENNTKEITSNLKKLVEGCGIDLYKFKIHAK